PQNYKDVYMQSVTLFQALSWRIYINMINYVKKKSTESGDKFPPFDRKFEMKFTYPSPPNQLKLLTWYISLVDISGIKEAVTELSSLSILHYFAQPEPQPDPKT